jgi:hypothetical protein
VRAVAPERARRLTGWALVLLAVVGLRVLGLGAAPPKVGAAALQAVAPDPGVARASQALGWLVADVDRSPTAEATSRCLEAGRECTPDDVLATDTTRLLLASVADALHGAADPQDPGYVGPPSPRIAERAAAMERAARAGADALGRFLSSGCAGSVDGVPSASAPDGCGDQVTAARDGLQAFDTALAAWRGGTG